MLIRSSAGIWASHPFTAARSTAGEVFSAVAICQSKQQHTHTPIAMQQQAVAEVLADESFTSKEGRK